MSSTGPATNCSLAKNDKSQSTFPSIQTLDSSCDKSLSTLHHDFLTGLSETSATTDKDVLRTNITLLSCSLVTLLSGRMCILF